MALAPGEARGLAPEFTKAGIEFVKLSTADVAASCSAFQTAVEAGSIAHVGQPELDAGVRKARTRPTAGGGQTWDCDTPVVAVAGAMYRWGMQKAPMPAIF